MADDEDEEFSLFPLLPEGCLSNIISFTSPKDACSAAAVSLEFKSAAESDTVWDRFLPPDYREIISASGSPAATSTKKELFFMLCDPGLLLDGGTTNFRLSRSTGKKCYLLSAKELEIAWKDNPDHWVWRTIRGSRFTEVAELVGVCWLEIFATIPSQILSPKTNYAAYLVFKLAENNYGLQCVSKGSIKFLKDMITEYERERKDLYIVPPRFGRARGRRRWTRLPSLSINGRVPCNRTDGWMEIELGDFFIDEEDKFDIQVKLSEIENANWKKGLIVEGIELRPKS